MSNGRDSERIDAPIYEVFVQKHALSFPTHVGSLRASSPELALELARETYCRRDPAFDVWVVPRTSVARARAYPESLPCAPEEKTYRLPSGYDNAPLWKHFKAEAQTIDEIAAQMSNGRRNP